MSGNPLAREKVTDSDYADAVAAQDAVLFAQGNERRILGKLRAKLDRGATDAGEKFYFDKDRGIVRRRERKEGSG